jgi:hypothetical protein
MRLPTVLAVAALIAFPAGAAAEEPAPDQAPPPPLVREAPPEPSPAPRPEAARPPEPFVPPPPSRVSLRVATGVAVDRGGANASVAAGFDLSPRFNLGLEAEYNPWFDYLAGKASPGSINAYLTASFRWFGTATFEVRTGLMAGASVLLFDAPGARAGSVGIFLGTAVLRASARISEKVWFEISPDAVLAVPSLRGVPLVYGQMRLTAAIRFSL